MKILSAAQFREADQFTISNEPVNAVDLMERAAMACFQWITSKYTACRLIVIVCGTGNNGGDGFALARMLNENGYNVTVYRLMIGRPTPAVIENVTRLKNAGVFITEINHEEEFTGLRNNLIVIDAIFGTGINRKVTGLARHVIDAINSSGAEVISIDIPSGMIPDEPSVSIGNSVVRAYHTLTFETLKLAFLFPENSTHTGTVTVLPIGLHQDFLEQLPIHRELTEDKYVRSILKPRASFSHKGSFGNALIVAGSYGKMGAAQLAVHSCMKTGAGLTTAHVPAKGYVIMQVSLPEAMVTVDQGDYFIGNIYFSEKYNAIGIGPGMGTHPATAAALEQLLHSAKCPLVLDADAINILSSYNMIHLVPPGSILTPHRGEFTRMTGVEENDFDAYKRQLEYSIKYHIYIVLKGKYTCISTPHGKSFFNPTGNPGMAKGGSGDVLTGMITAFLAQGYGAREAAIAGVYIHGLAADIAVEKTGAHSLLAGDIINHIPAAFQHLLNH